MKYLRYRGEFLSISDTLWRVEIWQESKKAFAEVKTLSFDADEPVNIEWEEKAKEDVICSSAATIKVISETDRAFEDLYSIEPGRVRADIYRDGNLYWSGCIDTEFYEEPYECASGYTVELMFSDFGVADRLKYDMTGMKTLRELLGYFIQKCGLITSSVDGTMVSTSLPGSNRYLNLHDIKVSSANFYDEDGEASTMWEVMEGALQPLGMKVQQRGGKIYVYDLNGLYENTKRSEIYWNGDSQTMSTDKVYNDATITWSTYAQSGNIMPERCWGFIKTDKNKHALNKPNGITEGDATYYSYHVTSDVTKWSKGDDSGFTLWTSDNGKNAEIVNKAAKFFKIVPQLDGQEGEGIVVRFLSSGMTSAPYQINKGLPQNALYGGTTEIGGTIFKTKEVWISPETDYNAQMLRVGMDIMVDPRMNPFEEGSDVGSRHEKRYMSWYDGYANVTYVPVLIKFRPTGTERVYVWDNRIKTGTPINEPITMINDTKGVWREYTETTGKPSAWGYLAYYDAKDRVKKCGITGWKGNRPAINPHVQPLSSALEKSEGGQYIPYPQFGDKGGDIWVEVLAGSWIMADGNKPLPLEGITDDMWDLWYANSWVMCKLPTLEILNNEEYDKEIDTDDVEYSATLNASAKEDIDMSTICGTSDNGVPTARGAYVDTRTNKQITRLTRGGRTATAEELLIGTLYSQYAERKTKLSGECRMDDGGLHKHSEPNQKGKVFIMTGCVEDVRMDTSDATYIELRPDEYDKEI